MRAAVNVILLCSLGLWAGCTTGGPFSPEDSMKFGLTNDGRFQLMDRFVANSVTCTGLQVKTLPDGRIEVIANVKNKESRRIQVQINCEFKDAAGASTGDTTPFQNLILTENATEAVHFTAMNTRATSYVISVRQAK